MIAVLRAELLKMYALKKVYAALLTVALPPLFTLGTLLVVYGQGMYWGSGILLEFNKALTQKTLLASFFVGLKGFSWIAWIYLMILVGETVAKEFSTGTMKTLLVQPVKRVSVYAGKFLAVLFAYLLLLTVYAGLFAACAALLKVAFRADLASHFPLETAGKIFAAWLVIDLTWLALAFCIACLATTIETTIYYNLLTVMFLNLLDVSLKALRGVGALADPVSAFLLERGFIRTTGVLDFETMQRYLTGATAEFPAKFDHLAANALWGCLFLLLGALLMMRREPSS